MTVARALAHARGWSNQLAASSRRNPWHFAAAVSIFLSDEVSCESRARRSRIHLSREAALSSTSARQFLKVILRTDLSRRHAACRVMGRIRRTKEALHEEARQHIAAVRAFHTGLMAESHRHLHVLATFTRYVDVLRQEGRHVPAKLAAVEACCRELANLRRLRQPWRDTFDDLRHSLIRTRALFRRLVEASGRKRTRV